MIDIRIEMGNHTSFAKMPAVPRKGDAITCSFPSSGIPRVVLRVTDVFFHQPTENYDAKVCVDPFRVVVTTDADPDNENTVEVFRKLLEASPEYQAAKAVREEFAKARSAAKDD